MKSKLETRRHYQIQKGGERGERGEKNNKQTSEPRGASSIDLLNISEDLLKFFELAAGSLFE